MVLTLLSASRLVRAQSQGDLLVFFGTYTNNSSSKGIYVSRLDSNTGALSAPELAAETRSPSFLAVHPTRDFLYCVNEVNDFQGEKTGSVSAFALDRKTGMLNLINQQSSAGTGPAHIVTDRAGRNVLVANYGGGSVAVLPIDNSGGLRRASSTIQHSGSSVNKQRQSAPHAHSINVDPTDRFAYVADLGLDKVFIYRLDASAGSLSANTPRFADVEPGSGPRHFALHPDGRLAYVINEMTCTVTAFRRDPSTGSLTPLQTVSTLPEGQTVAKGFSTAEVQVHPSGRLLYGSNRGHDTIVVFTIDEETGRVSLLQHEPTQGSTPRNFGIDPGGRYLLAANQRSDSIVVFRIDAKTGRLSPTEHRVQVGAPVCVKFARSN